MFADVFATSCWVWDELFRNSFCYLVQKLRWSRDGYCKSQAWEQSVIWVLKSALQHQSSRSTTGWSTTSTPPTEQVCSTLHESFWHQSVLPQQSECKIYPRNTQLFFFFFFFFFFFLAWKIGFFVGSTSVEKWPSFRHPLVSFCG